MTNSAYSNKNRLLFAEDYKKYFGKIPGAFIVKSRGLRKISSYLKFDCEKPHECDEFCLNDNSNIVNEIRLNENKFMILDEGLIETYPTEKVLRHFKKMYAKHVSKDLADAVFPSTNSKIFDFAVLSDENERVSPLVMICVPAHDETDAKRLIKLMTDEFAKTGYYMTSYDFNETKDFILTYIQFEAKYTDMLSELESTLYHISPLKNLGKILKNGLVPYSKAKHFDYSPRVYLFNRCPMRQVFEYGLCKTQEVNDNGFCVFKIDKEKLLNDPIFKDGKQRFYLDPAFSMSDTTDQTAVFTYGNVPLRVLKNEYLLVSVENEKITDSRIEKL